MSIYSLPSSFVQQFSALDFQVDAAVVYGRPISLQEEQEIRERILDELDQIYYTMCNSEHLLPEEIRVTSTYLEKILKSDGTVSFALKAWRKLEAATLEPLSTVGNCSGVSRILWIHSVGLLLLKLARLGDEEAAIVQAANAGFSTKFSEQLWLTVPGVVRFNMSQAGISEEFIELQQVFCRHRISNRDLIVSTGSPAGKASAVCLTASLIAMTVLAQAPVLADHVDTDRYSTNRYIAVLRTPIVIILCPNRELAIMNFDFIQKLCHQTYAIPRIAIGGEPIEDQVEDLKNGCDILVATPGRLSALSKEHPFPKVSIMVLDEVSTLMEGGFSSAMGDLWANGLFRVCTRFLAVADRIPEESEQALKAFLNVKVRSGLLAPHRLNFTVREDEPVRGLVYHHFKSLKGANLASDIRDVMGTCTSKRLIFANTKWQVKKLAGALANVPGVAGRHSDLKQEERERVLDEFEAGTVRTLITTASMADGVNVRGVGEIWHTELPKATYYDVFDQYIRRNDRFDHSLQPAYSIAYYNWDDTSFFQRLSEYLVDIGQRSSVMETVQSFKRNEFLFPIIPESSAAGWLNAISSVLG